MQIRYDVATAPVVYSLQGKPLPPIVNLANGPFAAGVSLIYRGTITDDLGQGVPVDSLASFTLTLADTLTGEIINSVERVDILNTGRGQVGDYGGFTVRLTPDDTSMDNVPGLPQVQRSLVIEWSTIDLNPEIGRHQANFVLVRLVTP